MTIIGTERHAVSRDVEDQEFRTCDPFFIIRLTQTHHSIHLIQTNDWRYQVATINLRDVPDDLHRRAKARAAMEGVTLKQLILRLLEEYLAGVC
jgi:predicted DNA binding CopG/RHH family protein